MKIPQEYRIITNN